MANTHSSFPFESNFVDIKGCKIHYIDEGEGTPVVFSHGVPTSSYLWRNIIPTISQGYRCIAPDMVGFGLSDKPDIDYSIFDHIDYFNYFIDALNLDKFILVMHGWGSVVGFHFAMENPQRIIGLAFIESHVRANIDWSMLSLPMQEIANLMLSNPDKGYDLVMNSDFYLREIFKPGILTKLSEQEWEQYAKPFSKPGSNKPIWRYLEDLPLSAPDDRVIELINDYSRKLQKSELPKLMMFAVPGFITTMDTVRWAKEHIGNLELVDVGDALHYPQESNPELISKELYNWLAKLD